MLRMFLLAFTALTLSIESYAANTLSISGSPGPLTINTAVAGQDPLPVSDSSTFYNIQNDNNGAKIMGSISSNMPPNTAMTINITAPSGATRPGPIALSTIPQILPAGIPQCVYNQLSITYTLSATAAAGVIGTRQCVLTLTLSP